MAHLRMARPYSGLGFQVKSLKPFEMFPFRSTAVSVRLMLSAGELARGADGVDLIRVVVAVSNAGP